MLVDTAVRTVEGVPVPAAGTTLVFDPAHSSIEVVVRHLMIAKVRGTFGSFSGTIHVEEDPETSTADVTIEAASINTGDATRDEHLRSADFLDVERFPKLEFHSTGMRRKDRCRFDVSGDLTLHGVTREVLVACEYQGLTTDPWGNQRVVLSAEAEIDRTEFGLNWNQALETGGVLVGQQVKVTAEIQAVPHREP